MINTGIYRHYKGGIYVVDKIATHTESGEDMVVYYSYEDSSQWWVRPLKMFQEKLIFKQEVIRRFEYLGPYVGGML